jgi:N-acetylmuramoyl-L-alanine amidase
MDRMVMFDRTLPRARRSLLLTGGGAVALVMVLLVVGAARPTVVLDPGHGGEEPGAIGGGLVERDSNLDMALRVRAILLRRGVDVVMTRMTAGRAEGLDTSKMDEETQTFADLQARVVRVNNANADVFVSLHSNSFNDPAVRGVEAWFNAERSFSDRNRVLADLVQSETVNALRDAGFDAPDGAARDEAGQMDGRGRTTPFFLLGPERDVSREELAERGVDPDAIGLAPEAGTYRAVATRAPGVLLELLYLSNPQDVALLQDESARDAMARGIAEAILTFLERAH